MALGFSDLAALRPMSWDLVSLDDGTRYTYGMVDAASGVGTSERSMLRRYDKVMAIDVDALATAF